ncbi:hypothetical protein MTR67_005112 [Solanum verrucosum]|uniref:Uncharacterized protein n=1 Tax=Solanum verrucosum TaxID=315347 RepID=A0AAF0PVQ3_SOLVR|nr:hypothetical protein MTR67_005112 [Solanum verrucosum]
MGETAVLNAARHGHTATVQYLIYKGADPAILSTSGAALHNAARNGHIELVELFLSMGVDIDLKSDVGTPLMWAVDHSQEDVVKVLLEHHANFNQVGDDNISPLQAAVAADSFPCVELLVKAGANVNVKAGEGMWCGEITPLLVAARKGNAESVKCLLQAGADPNFTDQVLNLSFCKMIAASFGLLSELRVAFYIMEMTEAGRQANNRPKKDLPEVSPEAKKKAADAKAKGDEAFDRKDFAAARDAYTLAISSDPTDGTLFSGRSDCWFHLGQGESALTDAKACKRLGQDLAKAYYREEAANAFYRGIQIDPNDELITALQGTVAERDAEAAKEIHDMELELSCVSYKS